MGTKEEEDAAVVQIEKKMDSLSMLSSVRLRVFQVRII